MVIPDRQYQLTWEDLKTRGAVLIASHRDPDGDAIASALSLKQMLATAGVAATVYLPDPPQALYSYVPGFATIVSRAPARFDRVAALDYGDWARLGLPDDIPDERIVTIDHHPKRNQRGARLLIDPTASSTCELLYRLCRAVNLTIDRTLAISLLTGIVADTGSFQHANTSPATLEVVEDLMLRGAPLPKVMRRLSAWRPPSLLKAWGGTLRKISADEALGTVYVLLSHAELTALNVSTDDLSSGFASLLSAIPNTRCAAFLVEVTPSQVRGSLRSEGPLAINVARVAQALGGGGHERAAGFTISGTVEAVWRKVKLEIAKLIGDTRAGAGL